MNAEPARRGELVGREGPCRRLTAALDAALAGQTRLVIVTGEAGMGKTTLITAVATGARPDATVGWGTCWEGGGAPGYWPWTQALGAIVEAVGIERAVSLAGDDATLLASIVPALGHARDELASDEQSRFALFDAIARWLTRVAAVHPILIVLDDLHWADHSSLQLLDFVSRSVRSTRMMLLGAHRHDELEPAVHSVLAAIATRGDHLHLEGLSPSEVHSLVAEIAGSDVALRRADEIHRRTGGHPFFVREVASLIDAAGDETAAVPAAVREAITRRVARADPSCRVVLDAAAVVGNALDLDLLAAALDTEPDEIARAVDVAVTIGIVQPSDRNRRMGPRFVHDLFRETLYEDLPPTQRAGLHERIASALARRAESFGDVAPATLARHFAAAVTVDGHERAVHWAFEAAAAESAGLAFSEAAAHFTRVRLAVASARTVISEATWTDLLVAEADALARAGDPEGAKQLLVQARAHARRCDDGSRLAAVAFGVQRLGARFAMPHHDVVSILDEALRAVGDNVSSEAQLTAAMARELQHSVAQDRPRAVALSEHALELARRTADPATLTICLLARHDVLWTPGTASDRLGVAREIIALAAQLRDEERHAEGLLLLTNALLETGSPAFRPALDTYLGAIDALGQPRHRYMALTRRAALALVDGRLDDAGELIDAAASLGEHIGEPDTGNVRMSQLLELTRGRGDPDEQSAFATEAVRWWVGAPVHAHAVAAGFLARAGDLKGARRHVNTVLELGSWRADRSYLSSVFIGNLTEAALALTDSQLCAELLDTLSPLASSCGVNGAVVAFSGSHAHFAGLAAGGLDRSDEAARFLERAIAVHESLGAVTWESESRRALAALGEGTATFRRHDHTWDIKYRSETATVADTKGFRDLAVLLSRPGVDVHVLELAGSSVGSQASIETVDREREALVDEVRSVAGLGANPRSTGAHAGERAREAVSARIRDAIRQLETPMPQLAAHLDQAIVTGTWCRYRTDLSQRWHVDR